MLRLAVFALIYVVAGLYSWWRTNLSLFQYDYYWGSLLDPPMYVLTQFSPTAMNSNPVLYLFFIIPTTPFSMLFLMALVYLTQFGPVVAAVLAGTLSPSKRRFRMALGWFVFFMFFWVASATSF